MEIKFASELFFTSKFLNKSKICLYPTYKSIIKFTIEVYKCVRFASTSPCVGNFVNSSLVTNPSIGLKVNRNKWAMESQKPTAREHMIAGTAGGLISTVALYPLELIKTRFQVLEGKGRGAMFGERIRSILSMRSFSPSPAVIQQEQYTLISALRIVLKNEGIVGLYRGLLPSLIASSGSWGGYFYFYEQSKARRLKSIQNEQQKRQDAQIAAGTTISSNANENVTKLGTVDHFLAGTEAGVILVFVFNPLWLVKTRLALQGSSLNASAEVAGLKKYSGMMDALSTIVKEEGFLGLYKGVVPALFLTSHGAVQFSTYELLKSWSEKHRRPNEQQPPWVSVFIGGVSKVVASTITYPYQVIKSRLQQRDIAVELSHIANNAQASKPRYTGMIDCIVKIWRNEGVFGFFKGVVPNVIKVAPSAALTFLVYEETMKLLKK